MRVLHLTNHVRRAGNGIVNVAVDLACLQARAGCDVAVASSGGEYEALLADCGVERFRLEQRVGRPLGLLALPARWRALVRRVRPDVVHAHMVAGAAVAAAFRRRGEYALVTTVHNEFEAKARLMGAGDRVIAVSAAGAASLRRRGVAADRLRVVVNGTLGSPRTRPLADYEPAPLAGRALVTVAGLFQRKGIGDLIEAFDRIGPRFPDAHLYLVGDGAGRAAFEAAAARLASARRIHFEGFRPEPQRYLRSAEVFVLASRRDPCPLVLFEALEAGCAIVGSDVDGIPEVLCGNPPGGAGGGPERGPAGLLVPPADPLALAAALERVLCDGAERQRLRAAASARASAFSAGRVARETMAVYREALGRRDRSRRAAPAGAGADFAACRVTLGAEARP